MDELGQGKTHLSAHVPVSFVIQYDKVDVEMTRRLYEAQRDLDDLLGTRRFDPRVEDSILELAERTRHMDGRKQVEKIDQAAREKVAQVLYEFLAGQEMTLRAWEPEDDTGPYGGRQQKVLLAVEDGKRVHPVLVVVYSDGNIKDLLEAMLDAEEEYTDLRERLVGAVEENKSED